MSRNYGEDFPLSPETISKFPFCVNGKRLVGRLNYVHHDMTVVESEFQGQKIENEVEEALRQQNRRQATNEELKTFFEIYKELLPQFTFYVILATEEASKTKSKLIPAIRKNEENDEIHLSAMKCEHGVLWNHSGILVLSIEC